MNMKCITKQLRLATIAVLLFSLVFLQTCKSPVPVIDEPVFETPNEVITSNAPTESAASVQFYHAYLADCVNDFAVADSLTAFKKLRGMATSRIKGALRNSVLATSFGAERLVWGPALVVNKEEGNNYTCSNLAYCTLYVDPTSGECTFSIGLSGTNMIAPYAWFEEDFDVESVQYWLEDTRISTGAQRGFHNLLALQDSATGKTLEQFLSSTLKKPTVKTTIAVSGHSLGGTLTQVLSSYLKEKFQNTSNVFVDAYVYAGPTAGDLAFARLLTRQLDNYYAHNNTLDAIPHVWQANTMDELCDLYNGLEVCHPRNAENPAINGVVAYLKYKASLSGIKYTIPRAPEHFTGEPLALSDKDCGAIRTYIEKMWENSDKPYASLNTIFKKCGGSDIEWRQFWEFFYFMAEMGHQHTTAYSNYFFGKGSGRQKEVNKYVPGQDSYDNFEDGKNILNKFVKNASDYINNVHSGSCKCGS